MTHSEQTVSGLSSRSLLEQNLKAAIEQGEEIAVGLVDLDAFSAVNADFGVEVGDRVLRVIGELLREQGGEGVYYVSGDEFALVLANATIEQAFLRMERVRASVEQSAARFALPDDRGVRVTIGVAQHPRDAKDMRGLLKAADAALAVAKEGGRNQVGLPPNENMVLKSCYYPATSLRRLSALAERLKRKESQLLREALGDLFRKYDAPREV